MLMIMEDQESGKKLDTDEQGGNGIEICRTSYPTVPVQFQGNGWEDTNQGDREKKQIELINLTLRRGKGIVSKWPII